MQTSTDLTQLATQENALVEWKENVADERDLVKTVVAFANDFLNLGGGYIVCGAKEITDKYGFKAVDYVGLTSSRLNEVKEFIKNTCYDPTKVSPPLIPKFEEIALANDPAKKVLVIIVDAMPNTAHTYKSKKDADQKARYFIRADSSTREANNGLLRELLRKKGQLEPWDKRINTKAVITDIDELVLRQYLQNMKLWSSNNSIANYLSDKEKIEEFIPPLLGKVGVESVLHPKNFALMVFGKSPIDFCAGAYAIFTIFDGIDKSKQQAETQWITGSVVEQANKLIELLNIESTVAIDKNAENANQSKYPKIALKEAVVNAIVHRDYETDQPTRVEVYADRVEIHSTGSLPFGLDKEKFITGKAKSSWRNQAFGRIFHKLNLAQHQGSGIEKIISAMEEEGCPQPIFEIGTDSVTCILPAHPRHRLIKQLSEAESDIVIKNYTAAYKKIITVLNEDTYNYRALELFCEVNNLLRSPQNVYDFIQTNNIDITQIRANTLVLLSESLSLLKNRAAEELSKKILDIAIKSKLEENQIFKVAYTLKKLGDDKEVVDFVNNISFQYPNFSHNPLLLDQKGRALIDLAKRCQSTYQEQSNNRIKNKAKEDFERYILEAQKVLTLAFEYSEDTVDKDYIQKALWYIKNEMMPFLSVKTQGKKEDRMLYVTKIAKSATEKEIIAVYSKYGEIETTAFRQNEEYDTKSAFITFYSKKSAQNAFLDRYNINLNGQKIRTEKYRSKE